MAQQQVGREAGEARLLRDLAAVSAMTSMRPSARARLDARLGAAQTAFVLAELERHESLAVWAVRRHHERRGGAQAA